MPNEPCECDLGKMLDKLVNEWISVEIAHIDVSCIHGKRMQARGIFIRRNVDATTNP